MKSKSLARLLAAAVAAIVATAMIAWRDAAQRSREYARFAECQAPETDPNTTQHKEMIEIQRHIHMASEFKVHPPEHLNKPIAALGNNCYVGSTKGHSETTQFRHKQKQLERLV